MRNEIQEQFRPTREVYTARITGSTPMYQGQQYSVPKLTGETNDAYDRRTWRNRMHVDEEGRVFVPPMALKFGIATAAKHLGMSIPGKGKATYTKRFDSGMYVEEPMLLQRNGSYIYAKDVEGHTLWVPADGIPGGTKRVPRTFPRIPEWGGTVEIHIIDAALTEEILLRHLQEMGLYVGLGAFRPERRNLFGRFRVDSFELKK